MNIRKVKPADTDKVLRFIEGIIKKEFKPSERKAYPLEDVRDLSKSYGGPKEVFSLNMVGWRNQNKKF